MKHSSGRPRGRAALAVGIGLMCAAMAAMVVKACQVEPVVTPVPPSGTSPPPLAATPAAAPALPAPSLPDEPRVAHAGPQLAVHNPCDQALLLAVNFGSTRGQRVSVGFFEVRSGARMSIAMTSGEIVIYLNPFVWTYNP